MKSIDILIFVEDPGAANYVAELPEALTRKGWRTKLLADGTACPYLRSRGVPLDPVDHPANAGHILKALRPRLLIVGTSENPDSLGLTLVDAARLSGIPSIGAVDAFSNAAHRFRGRSQAPLAFAPDWLLVPDGATQEAFVDLGCDAKQVQVCGHPHYDFVRQKAAKLDRKGRPILRNRLLPDVPDHRNALVFVSEISTGLDPAQFQNAEAYTFTGRGTSADRTHIVLEEFLDALPCNRPHLILRLHPKNTLEELAPYLDAFDQISQDEPPLDLLYAADFVVGMTSMLMLEAALMGRPTLSIVPRPCEMAWLPGAYTQTTPCIRTRKALRQALPEFLKHPVPKHSLNVPGGALENAVRFIEHLLSAPSTLSFSPPHTLK